MAFALKAALFGLVEEHIGFLPAAAQAYQHTQSAHAATSATTKHHHQQSPPLSQQP
jgi:hypothetical protein